MTEADTGVWTCRLPAMNQANGGECMSSTNEKTANGLDFTTNARMTFQGAVTDPLFHDQDLDVIYTTLQNQIRTISFGDYLKRYICQKAEMKDDYLTIPLSDYQQIICDEFSDRQTPGSFTPSTTRLRNLAKNWLTRKNSQQECCAAPWIWTGNVCRRCE